MQKVLCSSEPRPELSVTGYIAVPGFPLLGKAAFTGLLRTRQPKLMYAVVPRESARYGYLTQGSAWSWVCVEVLAYFQRWFA